MPEQVKYIYFIYFEEEVLGTRTDWHSTVSRMDCAQVPSYHWIKFETTPVLFHKKGE